MSSIQLQTLLYGFVGIGSVSAALIAVFNYRQKRTEWFFKLYEKYYELDSFREIEQILFYQLPEKLEELQAAIETKNNRDLLHNLDRYLNFFELVGSLRRLGRISPRAIKMLFAYNLQSIKRQRFLQDYINKYGYENLAHLLKRV